MTHYLTLAGGLGNQLFQFNWVLLKSSDGDTIIVNTYFLNKYKRKDVIRIQTWFRDFNRIVKVVHKPTLRIVKIMSRVLGRDIDIRLLDSRFYDSYYQNSVMRLKSTEKAAYLELAKVFNRRVVLSDCCLIHIRGGDMQEHVSAFRMQIEVVKNNIGLNYKWITNDIDKAKGLNLEPINYIDTESMSSVELFEFMVSFSRIASSGSTLALFAMLSNGGEYISNHRSTNAVYEFLR